LFWIPLLAILITIGLTVLYVPESPLTTPGRINWPAATLMTVGLSAVLIAVSETTEWGWGSPKTLLVILAGLLVLAVWVRVELRAREPLIDMAMMRVRGVWTTNLVAFLLGFGMYSSFLLIPEFVEAPKGAGFGFAASVTGAGLFMLPAAAAQLIIGPALGRLEQRFGSLLQLQLGTGFALLSFVLFAVAHQQRSQIYIWAALLGLGIGLSFAALANLIVVAVRREQTGVATGMNTVMRTLGGAFGGQLTATGVAAGTGPDGGFTLAFAICAIALGAGVAAGFGIPSRRSRAGTPVVAQSV
jgi:hypothetical protein